MNIIEITDKLIKQLEAEQSTEARILLMAIYTYRGAFHSGDLLAFADALTAFNSKGLSMINDRQILQSEVIE